LCNIVLYTLTAPVFIAMIKPLLGVTVGKLRVEAGEIGPNGEQFCWWQVTVKGGRETRDLDAVALARVSFFTCFVLAE
jgi:imidazole glycerol phosphate synthase subunit HisF